MDLKNTALFSVPGFPYSRLTLEGFIIFNTCLRLYGELKYLCETVFFLPKSRNLAAMQLLCNGPARQLDNREKQIVANRRQKQ